MRIAHLNASIETAARAPRSYCFSNTTLARRDSLAKRGDAGSFHFVQCLAHGVDEVVDVGALARSDAKVL